MSPQLHCEIARARQQEIARAIRAHHGHETHSTGNRRRAVVYRLSEAVAALAVCLAIVVAWPSAPRTRICARRSRAAISRHSSLLGTFVR